MRAVTPKVGGIFFFGGKVRAEEIVKKCLGATHNVESVVTAPGRFGSPLHGKVRIVFAWHRDVGDPRVVFGKLHTSFCTNVCGSMPHITHELRRGWRHLQLTDDNVQTDINAQVSEVTRTLAAMGMLPPGGQHHPLYDGALGADSPLARARVDMLCSWLEQQGKPVGVIDVASKHSPAHLDGSCVDVGGGARVAIAHARMDGHKGWVPRVFSSPEVLGVLGYHVPLHNLAVSPMDDITKMVSRCVPLQVVFAAVMSMAAVR